MKKSLSILLLAMLPTLGLAKDTIKVAATPVPHAEMLEFAKTIAPEDFNIEIFTVTDYVIPNIMLNDNEVDANFMQTIPYMEGFSRDNNMDLASLGAVHIEPLGGYSYKIKSLNDLPNNAKIAIPSEATTGGRALALLHKQGIITLQDPSKFLSTVADIVENPKNVSFIELDSPLLTHSLDEVDLAFINTNYALDANLNPVKDALIIEDKDSPYVNVITVNTKDLKDPKALKLLEILTSDQMKDFINEKYQGSVVPAF